MAIKGQIDLETGESKRTGGKIHQKPYNYRDDRKEVATILVDMLRDASNGDKKLAPWSNEMIKLNPNYRNTITGTTYKGGNIFRIAIGNRLRVIRNAELKANATHNEERYNALSQKNNLTPREVEEFKAVQSERNERLAFANWTGNDPRFVTMSGVQNMNAKRPKDEPEIRIRKGTKAIARIEYNKRFEYGTPEWEEEIKRIEKKNPSRAQMLIGDKRDIWINKPTNIFSAECCDNFPPLVDEKQLTKTEIHENCETILVGSEAPIVYDGGGKNYYSLGEDTIHLTRRDYFLSNEAFYATALHEIAHSTGHEDRLNRELGKSFGTLEEYALEELNAEFAAAMLSEKYGLPMTEERLNNHAVYLKSWADAIESNPNALDLAMTNASKIVDYIEQNIYSLGKERIQQEKEVKNSKDTNEIDKTLTIDNYSFSNNFSNYFEDIAVEFVKDFKEMHQIDILHSEFYKSLENSLLEFKEGMDLDKNRYIDNLSPINRDYYENNPDAYDELIKSRIIGYLKTITYETKDINKFINSMDPEQISDFGKEIIKAIHKEEKSPLEVNIQHSNSNLKEEVIQAPTIEEIKSRDNLSYVTPPPMPEKSKNGIAQSASVEVRNDVTQYNTVEGRQARIAEIAKARGVDYDKIQRTIEKETATWIKTGGYQEPVVINRIPDKKHYISKDNFDEICQNRKEIEARINAMEPKDKELWIRHANNTLQYHKFNNGKECRVKQAKVLATFVDQLQFDRQNNTYLSQGEWGKIMDNKNGGREDFFERTKHDLDYAKITVERIKNTIRDSKFANGKSVSENQMKHIIASRDQIGRYINKLEKQKGMTR